MSDINKTWFIYTLSDPTINAVRYVGITYNLKRRYYQHVNCKENHNPHLRNWVGVLLSQNLLPQINIIESGLFYKDGLEREKYYIAKFRAKYNLCNITDGGEGTLGHKHTHTEETRRKIGEAVKGKMLGIKRPAETRKKISDSLKGKSPSMDTREKLRLAMKGKPWTQSRIEAQKRRRENHVKV